jgi:hypothetical protein
MKLLRWIFQLQPTQSPRRLLSSRLCDPFSYPVDCSRFRRDGFRSLATLNMWLSRFRCAMIPLLGEALGRLGEGHCVHSPSRRLLWPLSVLPPLI